MLLICFPLIPVIYFYLDKPFSFLDDINDGKKVNEQPASQPANVFRMKSPESKRENNERESSPSIPNIKWHRLSKDSNIYRLPAYWEDLDPSGSYRKPVSNMTLITPEREKEFSRLMTLNDQNCWKGPQTIVSHIHFRKAIDMMLMGIEGKIFVIDKTTGIFTHHNFNTTIENLSGKQI